ncbi:MAG: peptide chain release factor-like protein [Nostoc sp.]
MSTAQKYGCGWFIFLLGLVDISENQLRPLSKPLSEAERGLISVISVCKFKITKSFPEMSSVFCDQERSPMQNKEKALAILKSKLFAIALAQGVQQVDEIQPRLIKSLSNKLIREYVLHPDTKVKDLRTNVEIPAATEVLDGKIDLFIKAYLQQPNQTTSVTKEALDNFK